MILQCELLVMTTHSDFISIRSIHSLRPMGLRFVTPFGVVNCRPGPLIQSRSSFFFNRVLNMLNFNTNVTFILRLCITNFANIHKVVNA